MCVQYRPGILFEQEEIQFHHFINFARDVSFKNEFLYVLINQYFMGFEMKKKRR